MKVKPIKFFRPINGSPNPLPNPNIRKRFELVKQNGKGKKLDLFM